MKLPDRWLPYTALGMQIAGTRFICFKVPLSKQFGQQLPTNQRFTPQDLLEQCPRLKLIVDLTNTTRYYNRAEFIGNGVEYIKLQTPGHVIPDNRFVKRFFEIADTFLTASPDKESLIGVHCTHGLNRTSYFVCRYMIDRMGFTPKDAISAFETARGHSIERANYVTDLLARVKGYVDLPQISSRGPPVPSGYAYRPNQKLGSGEQFNNRRVRDNSIHQQPYQRAKGPGPQSNGWRVRDNSIHQQPDQRAWGPGTQSNGWTARDDSMHLQPAQRPRGPDQRNTAYNSGMMPRANKHYCWNDLGEMVPHSQSHGRSEEASGSNWRHGPSGGNNGNRSTPSVRVEPPARTYAEHRRAKEELPRHNKKNKYSAQR